MCAQPVIDDATARKLPTFTDQVILVDDQDRPVGLADKLSAHTDAGGKLHRHSLFSYSMLPDN